ncbi:MAG: hypothetical protein GX111_10750 [Clostridiales bacterium]|jgi:rhodanese-related sulfurtransferase|nr:hypothetical protein [Clostridiales bacterium]
MKIKMVYILSAALCLMTSACSGVPGETADTIEFQGIILKENSALVTKSSESQLPKGQLISLNFPENITVPPAGSLYRFEIGSYLRLSWPPQGSVIAAEEISSYAGHTVISFDTSDAILRHLPDIAHLIDVRTIEEYGNGHVSGAKNISLDNIKTSILSAVPEKTDIVILYCRSGNRSATAGKMLEEMGYQIILDAGGIMSYTGEQVKGIEPGPLPDSSKSS